LQAWRGQGLRLEVQSPCVFTQYVLQLEL